jgi:hypothetical protein
MKAPPHNRSKYHWKDLLPYVDRTKLRGGIRPLVVRRQIYYLVAFAEGGTFRGIVRECGTALGALQNWRDAYWSGNLGPQDFHLQPPFPPHIIKKLDEPAKALPKRKRKPRRKKPLKQPKVSLFHFVKDTLGYDKLTTRTHGAFCKTIQDKIMEWQDNRSRGIKEQTFFAGILPRRTYKTTIGVIGASLYNWAEIDPDIRVLFFSATNSLVRDSMRGIRSHMEANPLFRERYGDDWMPKEYRGRQRWSALEMDIEKRTNWKNKESSLSCSGVGGVRVGGHYDVIIYDDLHNEKNTKSHDQIAKVKEHIRLSLPLLEPDGLCLLFGTRWDDADAYADLIERESEIWTPMVEKAESDEKYQDRGGLFFPEELPRQALQRYRLQMRPYLYACQFQNDPTPVDDRKFNLESVHLYEPDELPDLSDLRIYQTCDPASTDHKRSDRSVALVVAWDEIGGAWLLDGFADRMPREKVGPAMFALARKWKEKGLWNVGIETFGFQAYVEDAFKAKMQETGVYFTLHELKPAGRRKNEDRIEGNLAPLVNAGVCHLPKTCMYYSHEAKEKVDLTGFVLDEMRRFPRGKTRDILDTWAYQIDIRKTPPRSKPAAEHIEALLSPDYKEFLRLTKYSSPYVTSTDWMNT